MEGVGRQGQEQGDREEAAAVVQWEIVVDRATGEWRVLDLF